MSHHIEGQHTGANIPPRTKMTTVLGSVFLGDAPHHLRAFAHTTPPTSPSPVSGGSNPSLPTSPQASIFSRMQQQQAIAGQGEGHRYEGDVSEDEQEVGMLQAGNEANAGQQTMGRDISYGAATIGGSMSATEPTEPSRPPPTPPLPVTPAVSIELRLRWLEVLLLGVKQELNTREPQAKRTGSKDGIKKVTLTRRAEELQRRLDSVVSSHEGLKKFMDRYDQYAPFLTPSFALSGTASEEAPSYSNMSSVELDALLSEMEAEIRAADRDMREIEALEKRGVVGAGKLADYEELKPRLEALVAAHEQDLAKASELETRIAVLLEKHATKADALSELFVAWNDVITEAEDRVTRAEKDKEERRRLGYE